MSADINIPDHWQLATINDIQANEKRATITGPFGSSIGKRFFVSEGIPVIRGNNLSYKVGTFDDSGFVYITREKANELKGYIAKPGDLIFTAAGTIGQVALIPFAARFEEYIISNKQMRVRLDLEKVDTFYAYYWFSCPMMNAYIKRQDTGSTIPLINLSVLRALPIQLPPLQEQRTIATILKSLDDKIGINHKINQTLEQMAQAIFKSWFVDFEPVKAKIAALEAGGSAEDALLAAMQAISGKGEAELTRLRAEQPEQYAELRATAELFPSAMQESELGEIPEGWEISSIYGICDVIYGAPFKSKLFNQNSDGIPLIRIRDLKNERPGVSTPERHPKGYLVQNGDLLVGMDGEFKPYIWGSGPAWMNQRVCCFKPRNGYAEGLVRGFIEPQLRERELTATATTVIHLGKGDIDRFSFLNAGDDLLHTFSKIAAPLYKKVVSNKTSNHSLEQLRDTLLPKLLSGELSVSATEDRLAELANV